jgi:uncharacterized membrane protein
MLKRIYKELEHHAPFTIFGAVTGILVFIFSRNMPEEMAYNLFYVFHPMHVVLSALVTSSMYRFYQCSKDKKKCNILFLVIIGYVGSVGIATLSDSVIPFLGETLLKMPHREMHVGFIEKWWLINPLAIAGIAYAYFRPSTKFPHAGHVLVSTWASLFHMLMAGDQGFVWYSYLAVFIFLFLAVWLPCCISDIVFPLLFVGDGEEIHHHH